MEAFLRFLADEPGMQCTFISYHRKGAWFLDQDAPWLGGLQAAAQEIAEAVLRLAPERARGLELINNEADMKVGFDVPFEPRMTERFPAWLAASLIVHENLSEKYAAQGMQFIAASDNANQHLIRTPFDGRRSVMTRASAAPDDLLKLPVYAFYELLRLLGRATRHGCHAHLRCVLSRLGSAVLADCRRKPDWRAVHGLSGSAQAHGSRWARLEPGLQPDAYPVAANQRGLVPYRQCAHEPYGCGRRSRPSRIGCG